MVFRCVASLFKGQLCSTSEEDVVNNQSGNSEKYDFEGSFPINTSIGDSRNYSSTILTDVDDYNGEESVPDLYPWAVQSDDYHCQRSSPSSKQPSGRGYSWKKLVEDSDSPSEKPKIFTNIQLVRSKLFDGDQFNTNLEQVAEDEPVVPPAAAMEGEEKVENKTETDVNPFFKKTFIMNPPAPPVTEIVSRHRRERSFDGSDISSLSGSRHNPIEFNLAKGFDGKSHLHSASREIVERLKRKAAVQKEALDAMETDINNGTNNLPRCLILLMDPSKRIFEIVAVPYTPETTTVGEMLSQLHQQATDFRLARQAYTGLAYQGMHISPMVPVDLILEAESRGRPLFAVPEKFTAGQIEMIGRTLLETPKVSRVLEVQLERIGIDPMDVLSLPSRSPSAKSKGSIHRQPIEKASPPCQNIPEKSRTNTIHV